MKYKLQSQHSGSSYQLRNIFFIIVLLLDFHGIAQLSIDRYAVIKRHAIHINNFDSLSSLTLGNGHFAYTVDATGMQSFPDYYARGVPLGTQSEWGWHSFPNDQHYTFEETLKEYTFNNKKVKYSVQGHDGDRNNRAVDYFRSNPHRLQLANIGFEITNLDGNKTEMGDFKNVHQTLDLWQGVIQSHYTIDQYPVSVTTVAHPEQDAISYRIKSDLLKKHRIKIRIRIPSPTGEWKDVGNKFDYKTNQTSSFSSNPFSGQIKCNIDTTQYLIRLHWNGRATLIKHQENYFLINPDSTDQFELTVEFQSHFSKTNQPSFDKTVKASKSFWNKFWSSGAAVDFSSCTDSSAFELERRIILSQYLTRIQCVAATPPQETGLTYNSWYGRPHLEMHWWHGVHFALWGRPELLEQSLHWYKKNYDNALSLAKRQNYKGARWPKMTDPQSHESPSSVGSFLIWQQPHLIYLCELIYQANKNGNKSNTAFLKKYKDLIFSSADFMVDYLHYDTLQQRYVLGPGLIPAQERFANDTTINPAFELSYWRWSLNKAQEWRLRSGIRRNDQYDQVLNQLSLLSIKDSLYPPCESAKDGYSNPRYMTDHPSVLGTVAGLPLTSFIDTAVMKNTLRTIWDKWDWSTTWGWDYPMIAMAATRLDMPDYAIQSILMSTQKNTYIVNGHNYQDPRLTIYLPGNGGLLSAVAMMCAGAVDQKKSLPGFPNGGKWNVKWEGFKKIF